MDGTTGAIGQTSPPRITLEEKVNTKRDARIALR